jgi:hypothetical protein
VANKSKTTEEIQEVNDKQQADAGVEQVNAEVSTPAPKAASQAKPPVDLTKLKVEKSCSRGLAGWLSSSRISIAITSYQTGRVYLVGSDKQGRVSFFERIFERAMGIVGNAQRIYLGGLYQLWRFENVLRPNEVIHGQFDKCFVPRNAQTIGDLDIHELGICKTGKVVFVNTKYSCIGRAEPDAQLQADLEAELHQQAGPRGPVPPERPGHGRRRAEVRHRRVQVRRAWTAGATAACPVAWSST